MPDTTSSWKFQRLIAVVFVHVAHMGRVIQPGTEDQALYDDFFRDTFAVVLAGGHRKRVRTGWFPVRVEENSEAKLYSTAPQWRADTTTL